MDNSATGMSIVVPFLNEENTIPIFCETMDDFASSLDFPLEFVFVNDGSEDNSVDLLLNYKFNHVNKIKIIDFSKNFGAHAALRAGFLNASYDYCTWFGMDLQEPLSIITTAYDKLVKEHYEVVYFEKRTVVVSKLNRLFSKIYSNMMRRYAVKNYSSNGTATIAFGAKIKGVLNQNIESNSSILLQIMDAGFRHISVPLDYNERSAGKSKWTLQKKIKLFIDSFVAFSFMPIRLVSIIGVVLFLLGVFCGIFIIINRLLNPDVPIGYSTIASVLAVGFGITNISLGIIAEYLWRTYDSARRRPVFIISDIYTSDSDGNEQDGI